MKRELLPRLSPRSFFVFAFDLLIVAIAWLGSFLLRFNLSVPDEYWVTAIDTLAWVLPVYGMVLLFSGLYRGLWLFASLPDLIRIAKAVTVGGAIIACRVLAPTEHRAASNGHVAESIVAHFHDGWSTCRLPCLARKAEVR